MFLHLLLVENFRIIPFNLIEEEQLDWIFVFLLIYIFFFPRQFSFQSLPFLIVKNTFLSALAVDLFKYSIINPHFFMYSFTVTLLAIYE